MSSVYDCCIHHLPKVENPAGNLTALENSDTIPFEVKRVYYLYDVPGGQERGAHAHRELEQFMVAVSGAFEVLVNDGRNEKVIRLDRPAVGLHIVPGIWRKLLNFSSGAICLVLASRKYDESDYIRHYTSFKHWRRNRSYKYKSENKGPEKP